MSAHNALAGPVKCRGFTAECWPAGRLPLLTAVRLVLGCEFADFLFPEVALATETDALAAAACQPRCTTDDSRKVPAPLRRSL